MIKLIDINKLHPHTDNPRKDLGDLSELAESIKTRGILQNLTVVPQRPGFCTSCRLYNAVTGGCTEGHDKSERPPCSKWEDKGHFTVIIGHRRLAAAKLAGLSQVPCSITEMDDKTQIATMLLENIQRSDLTIIEQARGFQMMIDLGETVKGISEKTGFSETTVRHRVRLCELDPKGLAETLTRNVRIEDYIALEKISDLKLRNKVLGHIGTNNFGWQLNEAIETEALPERRKKLLELLEGWAEQLKKAPPNPYNYAHYFYRYKTDGYKKPGDADKGGYTFFDSGTDIRLYKKVDKAKKKAKTAAEKAFGERAARIEKLSKRAYDLRYDFVKSYAFAKSDAKVIMAFAMEGLMSYGRADETEILQMLGAQDLKDADEARCKAMIFEKLKASPERMMFLAAYLKISDHAGNGYAYAQSWGNKIEHRSNEKLDAIYDTLIKLGYNMSDEERQLRDGTHELFVERGAEDA